MKSTGNHRNDTGRLLWLLFAFLSFTSFSALGEPLKAACEHSFALLKTRTGVYTNVTVTKITKDWIFILHASGVCNIKSDDLTPDARITLGYDKAPVAADGFTKPGSTAPPPPSHSLFPFGQFKFSAVTAFAADLQHNGPQKIKAKLDEMTASNPMTLYIILGIIAAAHIFVSTCFWLICRKTHNAPGPLVWVPVLQLIPLLRAANMPRIWFFVYFVPVLNIIAQIVWSIKICKSRGKSPVVAFLLILPPTSIFAVLYLAFSRSAPISLKSTEILSLEVA